MLVGGAPGFGCVDKAQSTALPRLHCQHPVHTESVVSARRTISHARMITPSMTARSVLRPATAKAKAH